MFLRIRLQSHQVHLTMLQYYTVHMHAMYSQTQNNTYTKMNLRTVKWAQWDKPQFRELLGLFICVCSSLCTIVAHNTAQNRPDNFPSCPPDSHHCSDDVYLREEGKTYRRHTWTPIKSLFLDVLHVYKANFDSSANYAAYRAALSYVSRPAWMSVHGLTTMNETTHTTF